jgi:excisionase family DNA binding protein
MKPRFYSVKEFGELTSLSETTVYRIVGKGQIPAIRLGSQIRIPATYIDQFTHTGFGVDLR